MTYEHVTENIGAIVVVPYPYLSSAGKFLFCNIKPPKPGHYSFPCVMKTGHDGPHESWSGKQMVYRWYTNSSAIDSTYK